MPPTHHAARRSCTARCLARDPPTHLLTLLTALQTELLVRHDSMEIELAQLKEEQVRCAGPHGNVRLATPRRAAP